MRFLLTNAQILDPELDAAIMQMLKFRAKSRCRSNGMTEYRIKRKDKQLLAAPFIALAISKEVDIRGLPMYIEIAKNKVRNRVPATWPDAMVEDPENPGQQIRKKFNQYSFFKRGKTTHAIKIGHWPIAAESPNHFRSIAVKPSPAETKRFVARFASGDATKVLFGESFEEWKVANK